jgi:RNA polymerase sigma-B factor
VVLAPVLSRLSPRDQRIVHLRFVEERTQQEIAETIGLTQAQVSRVLTRILDELRTSLAA